MVRKADIARHLGITNVHAARLVKQGCPTTSLKAALQWREANPPKRAPVNKPEEAQSPRINPEAAEKSRKATAKRAERVKASPLPADPPLPPMPSKSGDSLLDALNSMIVVSDYAFTKFMHAAQNNLSTASVRLSEYTRALAARIQAEKACRVEQEHRGILVNKAAVYQTARVAIMAVMRRLERLPVEVGPQCNPGNPLQATTILERAVNDVRMAGARAIDDLRASRIQTEDGS